MTLRFALDLAAVERLIGGDSEVEVKLRESVVQNFTRRHLKALALRELMDPLLRQLQRELVDEFRRVAPIVCCYDKETPTFHYRWRFLQDTGFVERLKSAIGREFERLTEEFVGEMVERLKGDVEGIVEAEVRARMGQHFEERVRAEVARRLDVAVAMGGE